MAPLTLFHFWPSGDGLEKEAPKGVLPRGGVLCEFIMVFLQDERSL